MCPRMVLCVYAYDRRRDGVAVGACHIYGHMADKIRNVYGIVSVLFLCYDGKRDGVAVGACHIYEQMAHKICNVYGIQYAD